VQHIAQAESHENKRLETTNRAYYRRLAQFEIERDERLIRFEVMRAERRQARAKASKAAKLEAKKVSDLSPNVKRDKSKHMTPMRMASTPMKLRTRKQRPSTARASFNFKPCSKVDKCTKDIYFAPNANDVKYSSLGLGMKHTPGCDKSSHEKIQMRASELSSAHPIDCEKCKLKNMKLHMYGVDSK
jgi:hypothetical protein